MIALWIGHESMEITHIYVETDLVMKEKALENLGPVGSAESGLTQMTSYSGF